MSLRWMYVSLLVMIPLGLVRSEPESAPGSALAGYTTQDAAQQRDWERKFQDGISPDHIRENMRRLSARPHQAPLWPDTPRKTLRSRETGRENFRMGFPPTTSARTCGA